MNTKTPLTIAIAAMFAATMALPALAYISGDGKGKPETDCFIGLEGYSPEDLTQVGTTKKMAIQCTDGSACDLDGTENGVCLFRIGVSVNQPNVPGCTPAPLKKVIVKAKTKGTKLLSKKGDFGTIPIDGSSASTALLDFPVMVKKPTSPHPKPGKGKLLIKATKPVDKDKFTFICNPVPLPLSTCDAECPANTSGDGQGPSQLCLAVNGNGADLDNGFSGKSHNFPVPIGTTLKYCLSGCDSTNPECIATGDTGDGSMNGSTFGPPLPLFSAGVPVCVINEYKEATIRGTANIETGEFIAQQGVDKTPVVLNSRVFQCLSNQVCPTCTGGRCHGGARDGQKCTVNGFVVVSNPPAVVNANYNLSNDCPPGGSTCSALGSIEVRLDLTSGTSMLAADADGSFPCPGQTQHDECPGGSQCTIDCSPDGPDPSQDPKGGVSQMCCSDGERTPCFPTSAAAGSLPIVRTGEPAPPTPSWSTDPTSFPKKGSGKLVSTFCESATTSIAVNGTAGLPGPGALILPGDTTWLGNP